MGVSGSKWVRVHHILGMLLVLVPTLLVLVSAAKQVFHLHKPGGHLGEFTWMNALDIIINKFALLLIPLVGLMLLSKSSHVRRAWSWKWRGRPLGVKRLMWAVAGAIGLSMWVMVALALASMGVNAEKEVVSPFRSLSWGWVLALSLTAGIVEEVYFRGILQSWLKGWMPVRVAVVVQAFIFGLAHTEYGYWMQVLGPLLVGLVMGLIAERHGLLVVILAHALYDVIALGAGMASLTVELKHVLSAIILGCMGVTIIGMLDSSTGVKHAVHHGEKVWEPEADVLAPVTCIAYVEEVVEGDATTPEEVVGMVVTTRGGYWMSSESEWRHLDDDSEYDDGVEEDVEVVRLPA